MENNAWITLKGKNIIDNEEETFEVATEGRFTKRDGKYYVTYEGSEVIGYENSKTTLKIKPDFVSMIRFEKGGSSSQMVFEKQKNYVGVYNTPFGVINVGVYTNNMKVSVDDNGGEVTVDYFLTMNNLDAVRNILNVHIRKVED